MNRVRETRLKKSLTQEQLSELSKVSQKDISLIENNRKKKMSLEMAQKLAKVLDETVDYLFTYGPTDH